MDSPPVQIGFDFQQTHGTPFHGKRVSPQMLVWAVAALAPGRRLPTICQPPFVKSYLICTTGSRRLRVAS